ncbi:hypothetical protein [Gloeobacter kilaueensis]|uniref:Uncharacterized protein n=1 Tax=Gloeobacter kilaueensis (strain ATCC BAA-2537 / CCAP 1431/1 / ULC 316 / JS1) TaxID=1183438 RepID=U5QIL9_GLOK1|nr:hypothetical protein [Gloeobacter kilaueensis]AGY57515.1 hypothetical protein GKIL_1269 [Gloeobacter kilaueensis JS1]
MEPENTNISAASSDFVDQAYEEAQKLQQPAEQPQTGETQGGLTEAGEFVEKVVANQQDQPADTGRGQTSDLDPNIEKLEDPDDLPAPTERFGLLDKETGTEALAEDEEEITKSARSVGESQFTEEPAPTGEERVSADE